MVKNRQTLAPLETEEFNFIVQKLKREQHSFWYGLRLLAIVGVAIPLFGMLLFSLVPPDSKPDKNSFVTHFHNYYYLIAAGIILLIIAFGGYVSYWFTVRRLLLDTRKKQKIVERTVIQRKVFMRENNTCHFYLNSRKKLSIEVQLTDFSFYSEGDEINIEYSQYAGEYLGYF